MKRTLALVLAVLMVVTSLSFCVVAEDTATTYDGTEVIQVDTAYYFNDYEPTVIGDGSEVQELLPVEQLTFDKSTTFGVTFVYKVTGAEKTVIADDFMLYTTSETQKVNDMWGGTNQTSDKMSSANLTLNDGYYWIYLNDWILTNGKLSAISGFKIFHDHFGNKYSKDTARDPLNENENATFQMLAVYANNMQPTVTFYDRDGVEIGSKQHQYTNINKKQGNTSTNNQKGALLTPDAIFELGGFTAPTLNDGEVLLGWATTQDAGPEDIVKGVYADMSVYPVIITPAEEDYKEITFVDVDGKELCTGKTLYGKLMTSNHPTSLDSYKDGVYTYVFSGWTVNGTFIIDTETYEFKGGETVKPYFTRYGEIFETPTSTTIPQIIDGVDADGNPIRTFVDGTAVSQVDLTNVSVPLHSSHTGMTLVYKVDGAETDIIADHFYIRFKNTGNGYANPAWQWCDAALSADGESPYVLTLKNGYHFMYINKKIFSNLATFNEFTIFANHTDYHSGSSHVNDEYVDAKRTNVNDNTNATFTLLAVIQDNLQPTITFYDDDRTTVLDTYQHAYTNQNSVPNNYTTPETYQEGDIITLDEAIELDNVQVPTKENVGNTAYIFNGWEDADGNKVEYIYQNIDVYATYLEMTADSYVVTFEDKDGNELLTTAGVTGAGLQGDLPTDPETYFDGVYTYVFAGWSIDGETVVDPVTYNYISEVTFKPVYTVYGKVFDGTHSVKIPQIVDGKFADGSTISEIELLPENVKIQTDADGNTIANGITLVYKIEGADSDIIADHLVVGANGKGSDTGWEWCNSAYTTDGMPPYAFTMSNGYYFMYINRVIFNAKKITEVARFGIFADHQTGNYHSSHSDSSLTTVRENVNDNENATFTMLAVIQNNLQPTITFHDAEGGVHKVYQHLYTDVSIPNANTTYAFKEDKLITGDEAVTLSGVTAPEKASTDTTVYVFSGWGDKDGNKIDAIYTNVDLYPIYEEVTKETYTVTFLNRDGSTNTAVTAITGEGLQGEFPSSIEAPAADGVHMYKFAGWSVDGTTVVDPASYTYLSDVSFIPVFNVYGEIYENPTAVDITDTSKEINLMTQNALINASANGITWIYKVEGADTEIIADSLKVSSTANGNPAGQWNQINFASDGDYAYQFELNNGYYFLYVNDNLNNINTSTTDVSYAKFSIYGTNTNYAEARTPVNTNENATVTVLGVISDNLQPVITFHDVDGNEFGTYRHKYTDVSGHLSWGNGNPLSVQEGELINGTEAFKLSGLETPAAPEGYVIYGWTAAKGGTEPVDAIYDHTDLYPILKEVTDEDKNAVLFLNRNGDVVFEGTSAFGVLISVDYPATQDSYDDGYVYYEFIGWSVDGKNVVDPTEYVYTGDVVFEPIFKEYSGKIFEDPTSVKIPQIVDGAFADGSAITELNLLPEAVALQSTANGITIVYKVEGADSAIIADHLVVGTNGKNSAPAWQWCDLGYSNDGLAPYAFNITNGYHYMYINRNLTGTISSMERFSIFATHLTSTYHGTHTAAQGYIDATRANVNDNENATFTILAVLQDNLQPTVTFYNAYGNVYETYKHQYTNITSNLGTTWAPGYINSYKEGDLLDGNAIFAASGLEAPVKESDGTNVYFFTGWGDKDGNEIKDIWQDVELYPIYEEVLVEEYTVTFLDSNGNAYQTVTAITGEGLQGEYPTTMDQYTVDGYTYVFTGWSVDGQTIVDPATYDYRSDVTFKPVYVKAYNVTFLALNGDTYATAIAIPEEGLQGEYPTTLAAYSDGVYTYAFTAWSIDGETAIDLATYDFTSDVIFQPIYTKYGVVFTDNEAIVLGNGYNEDGTRAPQDLLPVDQVTLGKAFSTGVTFVYLVEGADTPIIADDFIVFTNTNTANPTWQWGCTDETADGMAAANLTLTNGYHFLYLNDWLTTNGNLNAISSFTIFNDNSKILHGGVSYWVNESTKRDPVNENENATFKMLAVIPNNLQPIVTFVNEDVEIGSCQYEYTNINKKNGHNKNNFTQGALISADDIYNQSGFAAPTKASDDQYVYVFKGWADAPDGEIVDAVYENQTVYAVYTAVPKTTQHTVTFVNDGANYAEQQVWDQDTASLPTAPKKADSDTSTYTFVGWALTEDGEVVDLGTIRITEDTTFYAVYTRADVKFTITYVHNGLTVNTETVIRSNDATYSNVPTEPTDEYVEGMTSYYHIFDYWAEEKISESGEVTLVPATLTNIQSDMTVVAVFRYEEVTTWYTVTWVDTDGTVLDTKKVAAGDAVTTEAIGSMDGTADENVWYTFKGWNKATTRVNNDMTVTAVYTTSPVATDDMLDYKTETVSGAVGVEHVLWSEEVSSFEETYDTLTIVVNITGASVDNPVSIGSAYTEANDSNSNSCAHMSDKTPLFNAITEDGLYFATLGALVVGNNGWTINKVTSVILDKTGGSRNPASVDASCAATYDAYAFMGVMQPEIKYYDGDGNWLYTAKYSYDYHRNTYYSAAVPTAEELYAGPAVEGRDAWYDAYGNVITYVTNNMSVYAAPVHECDWIATGNGTAKCADELCNKTNDSAFTVIADPTAEINAVKAGETVNVPVIVANGAFVGANLKVVTSDNVTVTDIDVTGTPFEGYTAEIATNIVLNAAMGDADITSNGTIVYLTLTANADIAEGDTVTVQVIVNQIVNIADEDITADVADGYVATYTAVVAEEEILWGDVNGDNELTPADIMLLTRYVNKWNPNTYTDIKNPDWGDVNGDNELTPADIMLLTRFINKWNPNTYVDAKNLVGSN